MQAEEQVNYYYLYYIITHFNYNVNVQRKNNNNNKYRQLGFDSITSLHVSCWFNVIFA